MTKVRDESDQAMREARAFVTSLPSWRQLKPEEQDKAVWAAYLNQQLARVGDEIGFNWQTAADFAGYLVPQENVRLAQVAKILGAEYSAKDYVNYADFYGSLAGKMETLPIEQRQKVVEEVIAAWPEIHGNNRVALADFLGRALTGDYSEWLLQTENALERVDQAFLTLGMGRIATGTLKSFNALRLASKANNIEATADIVRAGSQASLKSAGIDPLDAASVLNPTKDVSTFVKGTDNTHAKAVTDIQSDVDVYLEVVDQVSPSGLGLRPEEQAEVISRRRKDIANRENVSDVEVVSQDNLGFTLRYNTVGADGVKSSQTVEQTFLKDDVGGLNYTGQKGGYIPLDAHVTSPNFRQVADREWTIEIPQQLQFQGAKIRASYDQAIRAALKPINRSGMRKVDDVLQMGNDWMDEAGKNVGKVFTKDELVNQGVNGVKLSAKEYTAYTNMRKIFDHMYWQKNKEIRQVREANGIQSVRMADGAEVAARTYEDSASAAAAFRATESRSHWAIIQRGDGEIRSFSGAEDLSKAELDGLYKDGYRLANAREGQLFSRNGVNTEWAFVKADEIYQPSRVLNYRTGYVPRIAKDGHYFVKSVSDAHIGGRVIKGGNLKTVRYFDNKTDADVYAATMKTENGGEYVVRHDREMSSTEVDGEWTNIMGGLFTGARSSEPIKFGLEGTKGRTEGVLEGLQRYVSHLARNLPVSLYREGLQQRWLNHAKDMGALPANYQGGFRSAVDAINPSHAMVRYFQDTHHQTSLISGVRVASELKMLAAQRAVAEMAEKSPVLGKWLSRQIRANTAEEYAGTVRGAVFHLMLGCWNPAQFGIQASGALVAMSISPVHGAKAAGQSLGYAAADVLIGNPKAKAAFIQRMRDRGIDMDGYEAWDKSGLRDSITHTNLDYKTLWDDAPYDAGVVSRVVGTNTMFFKAGELVNARISFATAFNEWRAKPGNAKRTVNETALREIISRTEVFRLNMTKANTAKFQQGLTSVPTQFQQVNTKFLEKLLGKGELTGAEKTRLLVGQAALFGAAGVPLLTTATPWILDGINKFLPEEDQVNALNTDPVRLNAIYNGLAGAMVNDYMNVNNVITGRIALGQDFIENVKGFIFDKELNIMDTAMGPFSSVYESGRTALDRMRTAFNMVATADEVTVEDIAGVAEVMVRSLADLPSSSRNLIKAYDMTNSHFFKNKDGRPIAEWGDQNLQTIVAQALGFSTTEVADWHELNSRYKNTEPRGTKQTEAKRIVRFLNDMHNAELTSDTYRYNAMAVNAIMTKYTQVEDRVALIGEIEKMMDEPGNQWGKILNNILKDWHSEAQNGIGELQNHLALKSSPALARQLQKAGVNIPPEAQVKTERPFQRVEY